MRASVAAFENNFDGLDELDTGESCTQPPKGYDDNLAATEICFGVN